VRVASNGTVDPGSIFTQDGQASLSFVPGAFVPPPDRSPVTIDIKPVSPCPNPAGIHVATNAYCFTSSSPMTPGRDVLVTLQFSDQLQGPSDVYQYQDNGPWRRLGNTGAAQPFYIAIRATSLGCFAGGFPANANQATGTRVSGGQTLPIVVALGILIVVLAGVPLAVLRRRGAQDEED
jgi:hypothetical protein